MRDIHTPECVANHCGLYAIEMTYLRTALCAIKAGTWPINAGPPGAPGKVSYTRTGQGVAIVSVAGPMMKGSSKFPHANTLDVRRSIRAAVRDQDVHGILLHIDSPGGMVAGTADLADDVAAAGKLKPVHAHIDDLGASAAYWVASQAAHLTANRTAEVGSIGVVAVVDDFSKAYEMQGVETHVIATGSMKGAFTQGAPIEEAHLDYLRERVQDFMGHFKAGVLSRKGMTEARFGKVSDGRVWGASEAKGLHLIDEVASLDQAIAALEAKVEGEGRAVDRRRKASVGLRAREAFHRSPRVE